VFASVEAPERVVAVVSGEDGWLRVTYQARLEETTVLHGEAEEVAGLGAALDPAIGIVAAREDVRPLPVRPDAGPGRGGDGA
jgi:hypothetical protein